METNVNVEIFKIMAVFFGTIIGLVLLGLSGGFAGLIMSFLLANK